MRNDERPTGGRSRKMPGRRLQDSDHIGAHRQPSLSLVLDYEERPRVVVFAETEADEIRLLGWLDRSGLLQSVTALVDREAA